MRLLHKVQSLNKLPHEATKIAMMMALWLHFGIIDKLSRGSNPHFNEDGRICATSSYTCNFQ